ncbi:Bdr family repetitive protein (plasmid) [Borreliella tanukii]|uniref:Bdr family repetitive protein n=1 Tax=Borreliella tanukii TaxID=56146 RepID=UPI003AF04D4D
MESVLATNITEEQIYKEFLRLGMEQLIAKDLSKRYYHNDLTYRDLKNLEKQFGIKFENLDFKIDTVEKNLQKDMSNLEQNINKNMSILEQNINEKLKIHEKGFLEKLKASNRVISIIVVVVVVPAAISILIPFVMSLIGSYFK